jgi:hypothetical protein
MRLLKARSFGPRACQISVKVGRFVPGQGTVLCMHACACWRYETMSKETPKDDPRQQTDQGSHKQTDKPWKGNPEKEQRNDGADLDLEKWHKSSTH